MNSNTKASGRLGTSPIYILMISFVCIFSLGSCKREHALGMDETDEQQDTASSTASITTEKLHICPCTLADAQDYHKHIYSSQIVMEKFANGECKDMEYVTGRVTGWANRWQNGVPFSAFTVRTREKNFLGTMVLGGADEPNSSEIAYMIRHDEWGKGYGFEAVSELMRYADSLHQKGARLPNGDTFNRVIATCREDNLRSSRILKKLGFNSYKNTPKFGHSRDHYEYSMTKNKR